MKMTLEQHQKEVKELYKLEQHLIELIADIRDDFLRDKFLEWQKQRNKCNAGFNESIEAWANESR